LFPAIKDTSAPISSDHKEYELWKGSGTILLVDDEESIRSLVALLLEQLGFNVLLASDGREALGIFNKHKNEIDCVLLDLTMPRMDGEETFRELRLIDPGILIIMSSSYNEQDVGYRFLGKGLSGFIQKPYSIVKLSNKLKDIFEIKKDAA
jgi:CheY-like chemotaxis protein